jgi:hypothetical protein
MCVCVCVCVCIDIYIINIKRETERERAKERYTNVKMEEMVADVASTQVLCMNDMAPPYQCACV